MLEFYLWKRDKAKNKSFFHHILVKKSFEHGDGDGDGDGADYHLLIPRCLWKLYKMNDNFIWSLQNYSAVSTSPDLFFRHKVCIYLHELAQIHTFQTDLLEKHFPLISTFLWFLNPILCPFQLIFYRYEHLIGYEFPLSFYQSSRRPTEIKFLAEEFPEGLFYFYCPFLCIHLLPYSFWSIKLLH